MPAIVFFGKHLSGPLYPGTVPISADGPDRDLWRTYVRPMGAGAVAASGLITLLRTAADDCERADAGLAKKSRQRVLDRSDCPRGRSTICR